jgi:hypothetical protein
MHSQISHIRAVNKIIGRRIEIGRFNSFYLKKSKIVSLKFRSSDYDQRITKEIVDCRQSKITR